MRRNLLANWTKSRGSVLASPPFRKRRTSYFMKNLARHLSVGMMILVLAGITAFGVDKMQTATVSFSDDTNVGGTMVKAGEYRVKFNEETKEFTVMKGGKVIAKTPPLCRNAVIRLRGRRCIFGIAIW